MKRRPKPSHREPFYTLEYNKLKAIFLGKDNWPFETPLQYPLSVYKLSFPVEEERSFVASEESNWWVIQYSFNYRKGLI